MQTLKQLMELYSGLVSDTEICMQYLSQDEIFDQSVKVLSELCQQKIKQKQNYQDRVLGKLSMPNNFYYVKYPQEIATELDILTRKMQMEIPFTEDDDQWLKDTIPNINLKSNHLSMFWSDLYDYIHNKLNLKFKDE